MSEKKQQTFETSFSRLEEILGKLNDGQVGLDDSLKLYEEANGLIIGCNKRLNDAEQRIETLVKTRQGELVTNEQGLPQTTPYPAS